MLRALIMPRTLCILRRRRRTHIRLTLGHTSSFPLISSQEAPRLVRSGRPITNLTKQLLEDSQRGESSRPQHRQSQCLCQPYVLHGPQENGDISCGSLLIRPRQRCSFRRVGPTAEKIRVIGPNAQQGPHPLTRSLSRLKNRIPSPTTLR